MPILALARGGNYVSHAAVLQRAIRIILPLNRPERTVQVVNNKAVIARRDWQTPLAEVVAASEPVITKSIKNLVAVRPPPRWGINE